MQEKQQYSYCKTPKIKQNKMLPLTHKRKIASLEFPLKKWITRLWEQETYLSHEPRKFKQRGMQKLREIGALVVGVLINFFPLRDCHVITNICSQVRHSLRNYTWNYTALYSSGTDSIPKWEKIYTRRGNQQKQILKRPKTKNASKLNC